VSHVIGIFLKCLGTTFPYVFKQSVFRGVCRKNVSRFLPQLLITVN